MQLAPGFSPLPRLGPKDVASCSAAEAWFLHLAGGAEGEGQLQALACLLGLAWRHGEALPASQVRSLPLLHIRVAVIVLPGECQILCMLR